VLADGRTLTGQVTADTGDRLTLRLANGRTEEVPTADVEARRAGQSAMPENVVEALSDRDLRDLVAFLASLVERQGARFALTRLHEKLPPRGALSHARHGEP
jgi:cytochrome c553